MFQNYLKIAWRNITRNKVYTFINVLGLSLGVCACIVIYLLTDHELGYDKFHPDKDRIYRITGELTRMNGEKEFLNSPFKELAGIEHKVRGFESKSAVFFWEAPITVPLNGNKRLHSDKIVIVEPEYFDIFQYEWIVGDEENALTKPYQVVLTDRQAKLYFEDLPWEKMINQTIIYQDSLPLSVVGIVRDWQRKSDVAYTDFISLSTAGNSVLKELIPTADWQSLHPHRSMAFVKLAKGTTAKQVNAQLETIRKTVKPNDFGKLESVQLQSLTDMHFANDDLRADDGDGFRKAHLPTLYLLIGLAIFILVIACINFINLSTAQSIQRAKEVGVRKVMGGQRVTLILQFLSETFVLTFFAVWVAVLLVKPMLSLFSHYIPQEVTFDLSNAGVWIFLISITIITSVLAGFYPAKVLSAYLPAASLKGEHSYKGAGGVYLRKSLIIFQFTMSLIFIIGTLVINSQIRYMSNKDKGFKTDAIITINSWTNETEKLELLSDKLNQLAGVQQAILQGTAPMGFGEMTSILRYKGEREIQTEVGRKIGGADFIPFYDMKIVAGRNITKSDSLKEFVINEAYARALGFKRPEDAIGKFLYAGDKSFPIVGVVADFHQGSMRSAIKPAVIENSPEWKRNLAVKLSAKGKSSAQVRATITHIENTWKVLFPDEGFDYVFLDDYISWLFEKEKQTAWLMNIAMITTIIISCMGLFGLAMFMSKKRTKEIGIRKVLGASVADIATMLSREFGKLVLIATIIACPIAWYVMNLWLQDYAYRTVISWWIFIVSGCGALLIAMITVSFQSMKAAVQNPVKSLRTE